MSNGDKYSTPTTSSSRFLSSISRTSAVKRDSLAAELERDPQLSTAKRQQRTQAFSSHLTHASLERQAAAAQTAKLELETKLREKDRQIEQLEGDRRWFSEREEEQREGREKERAEYLENKRKADQEIRSLRSELLVLQEQNVDLEEERSSLSHTVGTQKTQISTLSRRVSLLEREVAEFDNVRCLAEERAQALEELQIQVEELSAAQEVATPAMGSEQDQTILREELQKQVGHVHKLETANAAMCAELNALRKHAMSVEVLKEQKRDLERKLQGADNLREKVIQLEAELEVAKRERKERETEPSTPSNTPISVTQSLSNLRLAHAQLMEEHGSHLALLRHREQELSEVHSREVEAQRALSALKTEARVLKDKAVRSEHKTRLAEREVSFLRDMVASFSAEEAANGVSQPSTDLSTRLQQLQALVQDYKNAIATLERELHDARSNPVVTEDVQAKNQLLADLEKERAAKDETEKRLKQVEAETEKQLEQIDKLEQRLWELGGSIGTGQHIPPGVRVLCLRANPAQEWEDHVKAAAVHMQLENEQNLAKPVEDLGQTDRDQSDHDQINHEQSDLEQKIAKLQADLNTEKDKVNHEQTYSQGLQAAVKMETKRRDRLQRIFGAKADEFREAVTALLGLKLAFYPNGQVRVTSIYDLDAAFVFQPTGLADGGVKMQLVAKGKGGPEELPQLMRYWVEQEQSIPGFLASLTLECYEKNKLERSRDLSR